MMKNNRNIYAALIFAGDSTNTNSMNLFMPFSMQTRDNYMSVLTVSKDILIILLNREL